MSVPPPAELEFFPRKDDGSPEYARRLHGVFEEYLAKKTLRLTRQRSRILDYLLDARRHLDLEDIYQALRREGIGRATVFRTLKLLEACALADHVVSTDGASRFEVKLDRPHHDHLICVQCGHIQEVRWPELEKIQARACKAAGFTPSWHRHEVFGRCVRCAPCAGGRVP